MSVDYLTIAFDSKLNVHVSGFQLRYIGRFRYVLVLLLSHSRHNILNKLV